MGHDFFYAMSPCNYYFHKVAVRYRYYVTFVLLALITIIWFFVFYQPLNASREYTQRLITHAQQYHAQEKTILQKMNLLEQQCITLHNQYAHKCNAYTSTKQNSVTQLIEALQNHNLTLLNHKLLHKQSKHERRIQEYMTEFCGSYCNFIDFFTAITQNPFLIKPLKITVTRHLDSSLICACHYKIVSYKGKKL